MPLETTSNKIVCPVILLVTAVLLAVFATDCSTGKNYKLLSVFFDGVPNPNQVKKKESPPDKKKQGNGSAQAKTQKKPETWVKIKSRHPDYFKNICNNCHDRTSPNFLRVEKKEDLCFTCHKPEQFTGTYVHGPVAVKRCLSCHQPHESPYKKLMRDRPDKVCASCHIHKEPPRDTLSARKIATPKRTCKKGKDCTDCHYGHVSNNRFFLKDSTGVSRGESGGDKQ